MGSVSTWLSAISTGFPTTMWERRGLGALSIRSLERFFGRQRTPMELWTLDLLLSRTVWFTRGRWEVHPGLRVCLGWMPGRVRFCGVMRPVPLSLPGHRLWEIPCIGGRGTPTWVFLDLPATTSSLPSV